MVVATLSLVSLGLRELYFKAPIALIAKNEKQFCYWIKQTTSSEKTNGFQQNGFNRFLM